MLLSSPLLSKPVLSRTGSVCLSIRSSICGSSLQGIRYCAFWCQVQSQSADLICEPVYKKSIWRRCSIVSRATTRALSPSGKRGPGLWMPCFHLSWVFVLFFFQIYLSFLILDRGGAGFREGAEILGERKINLIIPQCYPFLSCVGCLARQQGNKVHREPWWKQNLPCALSCFVPGKQLTSAVINAFSQMQPVLGRREWAGWMVLVPCCSILWLYILILLVTFSSCFLQFGCLSLISWYHSRQLRNTLCPLTVWAFPTLSLGTFLQECSYRLLGKMSVQMWRKWASD